MQAAGTLAALQQSRAAGAVALKVALSPQRARTTIGFVCEGGLSLGRDAQKPALSVFGHTKGARVYEGLFPQYQLPNGESAFFYLTLAGIQVRRPL